MYDANMFEKYQFIRVEIENGIFSVTQTTYGSKRNQINSITPLELTQLKVIFMPIQTL